MAPKPKNPPYSCYIKGCKAKLFAPSRFSYHFEASHPGIPFKRCALIAPPETPNRNPYTTPPRLILNPRQNRKLNRKRKRKSNKIHDRDRDTETDTDTPDPAAVESKSPPSPNDFGSLANLHVDARGFGRVRKITLKLKSPRALREMAPSPQPSLQGKAQASGSATGSASGSAQAQAQAGAGGGGTGVGGGGYYNKETVAQDVLRAMGKHPSMAPLNAGWLNSVWKRAREEGECEGLEGVVREGMGDGVLEGEE